MMRLTSMADRWSRHSRRCASCGKRGHAGRQCTTAILARRRRARVRLIRERALLLGLTSPVAVEVHSHDTEN